MDSIGGDALAGDGLLREMAVRVMGQEAARRAFDGVAAPVPVDEALGAVSTADPEQLATILAREQPQTAALVLGALDAGRASQVIKHIPEARRPTSCAGWPPWSRSIPTCSARWAWPSPRS
jgi:flagellar motor switch protein FliG